MSGWSMSTLILLGMILAVFFYGVYKLLRKSGLTLEIGGHWYGRLSLRQEEDAGLYVNQPSLSQIPKSEINQMTGGSKAEIEATTDLKKRNV